MQKGPWKSGSRDTIQEVDTMEYLYALGLIPAIAAYYFARGQYLRTQKKNHVPPAVCAHFFPHLVGWGMATFMLWFFLVAFWAQVSEPERIVWLLAAPVAFAVGEIVGLFIWHQEVHGFMRPQSLVKE